MSESKAGNLEAIRDWVDRYFYKKSEINDKFMSHDLVDLSNSLWRSGSTNVLTVNSRNVYGGNADGYYGVIVPNSNAFDVIQNPLKASGNHFKISLRIKILDLTYNGYKILIGNTGPINYLPSISHNPYIKRFVFDYSTNGTSWTDSFVINYSSLAADTWYRVEYEWDGQKAYGRLYDENDTLLASNQKTVSTNWHYDETASYVIGGANNNRTYYCTNTVFDIANTYWTANDEIVWGTDLYNHEQS